VLTGPRGFFASFVARLTGKLERQMGFKVKAAAAVSVLETRSPAAAAWWRENAPHMFRRGKFFVFSGEVGRVIESESSV
jgi:hypothetical protein